MCHCHSPTLENFRINLLLTKPLSDLSVLLHWEPCYVTTRTRQTSFVRTVGQENKFNEFRNEKIEYRPTFTVKQSNTWLTVTVHMYI